MAETIIHTASLAEMVGQSYPRRLVTLHEFAERLHSEISRSRRFKLKISCLLVGVSGYDGIVAEHGEEWGESLIEEVGSICLGSLRESDVVSRYALDAFALLLTHTDLRDAPVVANKILSRVQGHVFTASGKTVRVGLCIGMSQFPDVEVESAIDFIRTAEAGLYAAEQKGPGTISEGAGV